MPDGVERILPFTFYNCDSLERADLPESVREIGESAFGFCSSMKENTNNCIIIGD
ncbi:leucine-rich repeat protein [Ruminococcus bicirculans (ex Wegman et al. 2014)]|uniref:leucine-rich repeat protein n=1 Tax=Ruminococcus bicirculans (ex Wegman et al. 2014) TaxID=1160721 RepID=UPI003A934BCF